MCLIIVGVIILVIVKLRNSNVSCTPNPAYDANRANEQETDQNLMAKTNEPTPEQKDSPINNIDSKPTDAVKESNIDDQEHTKASDDESEKANSPRKEVNHEYELMDKLNILHGEAAV